MSFEDLFNNRNRSAEEIKKDAEAHDRAVSTNRNVDDRFWKLPVENKNGAAIIRFLPGYNGTPYIRRDSYFIKTNYGSFFAHAPESAGVKSFPAEIVSKCWVKYKETQDENWKNEFKKRIARERYVANILVIDDKKAPENNGKVFLFEFSPQVYNLILEAQGLESKSRKKKEVSDVTAALMQGKKKNSPSQIIDPFDFWKGANFVFLATPGSGDFYVYENSYFEEPSELFNGDVETLKVLYEKQYDLKELLNQDNFEDYESLRSRYIEETGDLFMLFPEMRNAADSAPSIRQSQSTEDRLGMTKPSNSTDKLVTSDDEVMLWEENDDNVPKKEAKEDSNPAKDDIDALFDDLGLDV